MNHAKLTACTAALLLSSTALMAQEAGTQTFTDVYVDVDGAAVLIPVELALEACGLDEAGIQQAATSRFEESGFDSAMMQNLFQDADSTDGAAGTTGTQDTAAANTGDAADTIGTTGTVTAEAADGTGEGTADGAGTTMTAEANTTTNAGNTTTDVGNTTTGAETATTADAGDATGATDGTQTTDTATADAGTDVAAEGSEIENVEATAANSADAGTTTNAQGTADATTTEPGDEFLVLAVCQLDLVRASELGIPMNGNEIVTD